MTHNFRIAKVELRGVTKTEVREERYGGKNIRILCDAVAAKLLDDAEVEAMPSFRDAAIASEFAWQCLDDSRKNDLPSIGDNDTLVQIRARRAAMEDGYGLIHKRRTKL
jgi:myo-inositol 2-dehydrogenase/D-chiro-inositol 1-dehydrogenase